MGILHMRTFIVQSLSCILVCPGIGSFETSFLVSILFVIVDVNLSPKGTFVPDRS